jgi:FkbM family methyltransferase
MQEEKNKIFSSPFLTIAYNTLLATYFFRKSKFLFPLWRKFWDLVAHNKGKYVSTYIHGSRAIVPVGHWYLLVLKTYPKFNSPLKSLIRHAENYYSRNLVIVDVGSAVGDTVLLIEEISSMKNKYICIDGDAEYNLIINENLKHLKERFYLINSLISSNEEEIGKIVKDNPTTGIANSEKKEKASFLDKLLRNENTIDVIKIDIDGFDGKAISGASEILNKFSPMVIFEWNVPLFESLKNDIYEPFKALYSSGYNKFYWFDNFGNFLLLQNSYDESILTEMAKFSNLKFSTSGLHYDIIAMKESHNFIEFIN